MMHTPGPWRHSAKNVWNKELNTVIAQCWDEAVFSDEKLPARDNARLIAATPDLLAACEATVAIENYTYVSIGGITRCRFCDHPQRPTGTYDAHNESCAIRMAQEAIIKAKGQTE